MYSFSDVFSKKEKILFVFAHPDDIDAYFGGTIALLLEAGKDVQAVIVTNGARGSKLNNVSEAVLGAHRQREQKESFNVLGLGGEKIHFLNYLDGEVENNLKLIGQISHVIRLFRPDLVVTFEPDGYYFPFGTSGEHYINHRDHRNTGQSAIDAVYPFSRDLAFFREQISDGITPHTVSEILLTGEQNRNVKIDISQVVEKKRQALFMHKSQLSEEFIERILNAGKEGETYYEYGTFIKLAW